MNIVIHEYRTSRLPVSRCGFDGCDVATREGKPFCSDHVEHNPYAKRVIELIAQREKDDAKAATRRRGVKANSITAGEILQTVSEYGSSTKARLCKDLNIKMRVLDGYISVLYKEGKIVIGQTRKGAQTISLAG